MIIRKVLYLFLATFFFSLTQASYLRASSPTPTREAADKINQIKEKVAAKVEELRGEAGAAAVVGRIMEINEPNFKVRLDEKVATVATTDETDFFHLNAERRKISSKFGNYEKGEEIAAAGSLDRLTEQLNASVVYSKTPRSKLTGTVVSVGKKSFVLEDLERDKWTVESDSDTAMETFDGQLIREADFEEVVEGLRVHVNGFTLKGKAAVLRAERLLLLPTVSEISPKPTLESTSPTP